MVTRNSWNNQVTGAGVTFTGGQTDIGTDAASNNINIGTGAAAKTITVGNTTGASVLALKYGTGDMTLASATGTVMSALDTGEITYPLQSAFQARLTSGNIFNATGNGADYQLGTTALTETFDQNSDFNVNGTFTAPVTGKYCFYASAYTTNNPVASNKQTMSISTSNRDYFFHVATPATGAEGNPNITCFADMDAGDVSTAHVFVYGGAGNTSTILSAATNFNTGFGGHLVC